MNIDAMNNVFQTLPSYGKIPSMESLSDGWLCAFANEDTEHILQSIVVEQARYVLDGISIVEELSGKKCAGIILPDKYNSDVFATRTLPPENFIHIREYPQSSFIHPLRLAQLAQAEQLSRLSFWIVVDGAVKELTLPTTDFSEILPGTDSKAVLINHGYYPPEVAAEKFREGIDLGSGVIRAVDRDECLLQAALEETYLIYRRSCGMCTFCREGLYQITATLESMKKPGTQINKLDLVKELGSVIGDMTMCSVGQAAAKPIMTAMQYFPEEINAHLGRGKCPAGRCSGYMNIYIDPLKCQGDGNCIDACPKSCIDGRKGFISIIDDMDCDKCGKCIDACDHGAVILTGGRVPRLPQRPTRVGRFR